MKIVSKTIKRKEYAPRALDVKHVRFLLRNFLIVRNKNEQILQVLCRDYYYFRTIVRGNRVTKHAVPYYLLRVFSLVSYRGVESILYYMRKKFYRTDYGNVATIVSAAGVAFGNSKVSVVRSLLRRPGRENDKSSSIELKPSWDRKRSVVHRPDEFI